MRAAVTHQYYIPKLARNRFCPPWIEKGVLGAIFYQFSRSEVERSDFSHFLSLYGPDKLPTGRRLRDR